MMYFPARQQGVAIITVLGLIALIVAITTEVVSQLYIDIRRAQIIVNNERALMYVYALESYAKSVLEQDAAMSEADFYSDTELWTNKVDEVYDGGQLSAEIIDLGGRFNLNNLRRIPTEEELNAGQQDVNLNSRWHTKFLELLSGEDGIEERQAVIMVDSLSDWLDNDAVARLAGGEDEAYTNPRQGSINYVPPNTLIASLDELNLIQGFDEILLEEARPPVLDYLSAIPIADIPINVNTADIKVLAMLSDKKEYSKDVVNSIDAQRVQTPFVSLDAFFQFIDSVKPVTRPDPADTTKAIAVSWKTLIDSKYVSVRSYFFMMRSHVKFGEIEYTAYSTLQRLEDGVTNVISRRIIPA